MSFYELALLLPFILPLCSAQSTYYVTPTPDTPCPVDACLSFVEHTRQGGGHLENATLVFLPGTHTIESSIEIGNLTSLTLLGNSSSLPQVTSRIVCSQPASISFQCIENLFISALGIVSCGFNDYTSGFSYNYYGSGAAVKAKLCGSEYDFQGAAVVAKSVQNLTISNCHFQNNTNLVYGGALAVGGGTLTISQTIFKYNSAFYNGGGVYIRNSVANFTRNQFENNQADSDGGGVYIENSDANFTENHFKNNQANEGGGVAIFNTENGRVKGSGYIENSIANFVENKFKNNQANIAGCGVYIENSVANFTGNHFENNQADGDVHGGGIHMRCYSVVNFTVQKSIQE